MAATHMVVALLTPKVLCLMGTVAPGMVGEMDVEGGLIVWTLVPSYCKWHKVVF